MLFCCMSDWLTVGNYDVTQVVLESLRMASIISFTFREAVADVEYKGKRNTRAFYATKNQNKRIGSFSKMKCQHAIIIYYIRYMHFPSHNV